jgi:hypothetical protein
MWEPICILCFSDFERGQRNDKPLTSLASPRFEMLSTNPSRDSVFAGLGLITQLGRNWNASVYYNTDFGSATSNTQIVSASVGYIW